MILYVRVWVYVSTCIFMFVSMCVCVHACVSVYLYIYACMSARVSVCVWGTITFILECYKYKNLSIYLSIYLSITTSSYKHIHLVHYKRTRTRLFSVCMYVSVYVLTYLCVRVHADVCNCMFVRVRMCVCVCMRDKIIFYKEIEKNKGIYLSIYQSGESI